MRQEKRLVFFVNYATGRFETQSLNASLALGLQCFPEILDDILGSNYMDSTSLTTVQLFN